jgi:hypothetical protein
MRLANTLIIAALAAGIPSLPAEARQKVRYEYNGHYYASKERCLAEKRRSVKRGTLVGAATAGIGAALLGGNLGESALIAGGGAVVGNAIAHKTHRC